MARRGTRWTRSHAEKVIDELGRSGLTVAEFARSRNLHPKRIHVWRKRLQDEAQAEIAPPRMVELVAVAPPAIYSLTVRCPSGHAIDVTASGLTEGLRAVLAALPGAIS